MSLSLFLLGPFVARLGQDHVIELTSSKARALLAYLAVERDHRHYREALAGLLWPAQPTSAARGSLRQALQVLRRAIGDEDAPQPLLLVSRETIQLNPQADYWLDVAALEQLTPNILRNSLAFRDQPTRGALEAAVALYRGPFLADISLNDSPAFEEWLLLKREQLNRQALDALRVFATCHEQSGDLDQALACTRRITELEPWHEEAHRQAMRLLALMGRRAEAIAQYRHCYDLLVRELAVEPEPETKALYERIRTGKAFGAAPVHPLLTAHEGLGPSSPVPKSSEAPPQLIAREEELSKLESFITQALAGEGRIALVMGEAGSGKTALVEGFGRQVMDAREGLLVALGRCSAHIGAGDPYQPFRGVLWTLTGEPEVVLSPTHARRLQAVSPLAFEALLQQAPDIAFLLMRDPTMAARARACLPQDPTWSARLDALVERAERAEPPSLQQTALCEQATRTLQAIAQRLPLLIVLDDLQWADAPSLDMLSYLGRHLHGHRILIVGATRPDRPDLRPVVGQYTLHTLTAEWQRQWGDIRVDLTRAQGRRFVDAYLDSWPNRLKAPFRHALASHTGGNALFTIELLRAMQNCGDLLRDENGCWIEGPGLIWDQVPPKVEGAIAQRIDELTTTQRELLTIASVEGSEFHAETLASVSGLTLSAVLAELSGPLNRQAHLVVPGSLVQVGGRQLAKYHFRHGLFQNHLYESLDAAARAHLHGAVGAALEELYGVQAGQLAARLAQDFQIAGQAAKAAGYLLKAGQQAEQIGAQPEAVACYERGLALLSDLPAGPERTELEFALQIALDNALLFSAGWGAPERLRASGRAYELGQEMGPSTSARLRALRGVAELYAARGDYEHATRLAEELLLAAEQGNAPLFGASAHAILSICLSMRGELVQAQEHVSHALDYCISRSFELTAEESQALCPHAQVVATFLHWARGEFEQAQGQIAQLLATPTWSTARTAAIHSLAAILYAQAHEDRLAQEQAEEALGIIGDKSLPEVYAWGEGVLGWAQARAEQTQEGLEHLADALSLQAARNTLPLRFVQQTFLIEAYLASRQADLALETASKDLAQMEHTGVRFFEAELWRLRGEGLLQSKLDDGVYDRAVACFEQALGIARRQGARLWELRATVSLARLWAQQGKARQAHEALGAIYATFGQEFDTPDLCEAKALLGMLGAQDR